MIGRPGEVAWQFRVLVDFAEDPGLSHLGQILQTGFPVFHCTLHGAKKGKKRNPFKIQYKNTWWLFR